MWMILTPILTWAKDISAKVWLWVVGIVAILAAAWVLYSKGKRAERDEVERRVLGKDLENRRVAETIRGTVDVVDDPVGRLRRDWSRPRD
jgi:cytochrome c-type biogenesis protein CcmH/NrfF